MPQISNKDNPTLLEIAAIGRDHPERTWPHGLLLRLTDKSTGKETATILSDPEVANLISYLENFYLPIASVPPTQPASQPQKKESNSIHPVYTHVRKESEDKKQREIEQLEWGYELLCIIGAYFSIPVETLQSRLSSHHIKKVRSIAVTLLSELAGLKPHQISKLLKHRSPAFISTSFAYVRKRKWQETKTWRNMTRDILYNLPPPPST